METGNSANVQLSLFFLLICDGEEVHRGSHLWTVSTLELHMLVGEHQQVAPDKLDHRVHRRDPILRERTTVFLNKIPKFFLIRKIFLTCSASNIAKTEHI